MWTHYAVGLLVLALVLCAWIAVQRAWWRAFATPSDDPDALADRLSCRGACEPGTCARRRAEMNAAPEENHP